MTVFPTAVKGNPCLTKMAVYSYAQGMETGLVLPWVSAVKNPLGFDQEPHEEPWTSGEGGITFDGDPLKKARVRNRMRQGGLLLNRQTP